jgi:hypothetical protein
MIEFIISVKSPNQNETHIWFPFESFYNKAGYYPFLAYTRISIIFIKCNKLENKEQTPIK